MSDHPEANVTSLGYPIPTIDRMFDEPEILDSEIISKAHANALARARTICDPEVPIDFFERDVWGVTAKSAARKYQTPGGQEVELTLYMMKDNSAIDTDPQRSESIGLSVKADDFISGPIMRLTEYWLFVSPNTSLDMINRKNYSVDLASFFSAMELFDGQASPV